MEIRYTAELKRNLRHLAKRYRRIRRDIDPVLVELQAGRIVGVQIPGIGETLFKARVRNSDAQRGKSGGYRLIYHLVRRNRIILVTIYSKSDQGDVTAAQIRSILAAE